MALLLRPDIQFARDDANRFLPWMIALMTAMATLMLCLGLTLSNWMGPAQNSLRDTLTVQIPEQAGAQAGQKALALLQKMPQLRAARTLERAEVQALVKPWLGLEDDALKALALPTVLEATLTRQLTDAEATSLQRQLAATAEGASLDTRAQWAEKFARLTHAVQAIMYVLASSIVVALVGMMVFAARAAMKLHESTVKLLHGIGAEDGYIARQFQQNALSLSLRGALPGACAAGMAYVALGQYIARLDAPGLPPLSFTPQHVAMLVMLPLACAAVGWIAVRYATLAQLGRLP